MQSCSDVKKKKKNKQFHCSSPPKHESTSSHDSSSPSAPFVVKRKYINYVTTNIMLVQRSKISLVFES